MATRNSTTDEPQDRNPELPARLEALIERERTRLMTARTVLGCTTVAINQDRSVTQHQFVYSLLIELALTMIDKTTERLDSACLQGFYERAGRRPDE